MQRDRSVMSGRNPFSSYDSLRRMIYAVIALE